MDWSLWHEFQQLTPLDWAVVAIATSVSLLGALLPHIGNLLGRLFLGEDPLLARWKVLSAARRERTRAARLARKEAKKAAKALRSQAKLKPKTQAHAKADGPDPLLSPPTQP